MKDRNCSSLMRCASSLQRLFFLALLSIIAIGAYAQGKTVSGTVLDKSGESVIGASVVVKGTTNGTITDFDGKFTLSNVPNDASLEISFVGYKTQVIPVQGKNTFNVTMVEDTEVLDEVVVVGYGVQKKSDVTGAMARVGEKELKAMPVKNALEGMQGKTAGVDITSSQRPGEVGSINIRGVRSITADQGPLYVVDGMIIQNGGIENINPSDIESIDVLKDASATAIYGSRGANGVILVTTKKGKEGGGYSADGAIYSEQNTYYESNNLEGQESVYNAQSSLSGMHLNSVNDVYNSQTDAPIYQALNCTSNAEKMMCFLLNERTRELCGEGYRWEDLARTKTLDARWHAFNDGVSRGIGEFNPDKHYYRPISQSFLDGITNESGAALTNEEKQAMQNPGY